ncbi:uncharacterized protein LOC121875885 [Homarus americanus]|uniref:Putative crustin-like antimicrobial peptide 19 n=1 Tax=Homarus americanus TaxID=6706 RepID=A0A8J5JRI7_HOMAM|nr:uncharacterized protein LOC121875885 [Homarus americanus]KAG7160758.1 putative crustin-like antimicrobial peptide 19 [Homarus americanus]
MTSGNSGVLAVLIIIASMIAYTTQHHSHSKISVVSYRTPDASVWVKQSHEGLKYGRGGSRRRTEGVGSKGGSYGGQKIPSLIFDGSDLQLAASLPKLDSVLVGGGVTGGVEGSGVGGGVHSGVSSGVIGGESNGVVSGVNSDVVSGVNSDVVSGVSIGEGGIENIAIGKDSSRGAEAAAEGAGCRYYCRTPTAAIYCCEEDTDPATRPEVKSGGVCPAPETQCSPDPQPIPCSNDSRCPGEEKCCFDVCHERHICVPSTFF